MGDSLAYVLRAFNLYVLSWCNFSYCTECFSDASVLVILQQKMYQLFLLMFPQHVELCSLHRCMVFLGSFLTGILR